MLTLVAAVCTHPLDLTKVRLQTLQTSGGKRPGMFAVIRSSVAQSGFRSLYVGLTASILRQMTYSLVRLGSYERIKSSLSRYERPSPGTLLLAAMLAGGLGGIAGNPADILLVRMTSDSIRPPEQRYGYSNAFSGLLILIREEGVRGLFRGLGTNTTRAVLMNVRRLLSYDFFKSILLSRPLPIVRYQVRDNIFCHIISSVLAGTVATTVCAPADVLKSRLMSASGKLSPVEVLTQSLREEGPRFLFKGWTPAFIRLGPNTVLMFVFYEQLKNGWRKLVWK
ncbi:mitochondrial carrier [Panus rudis PR-1116 ss-1]|nr:mitochondrial carrier [Panus rudis PR-1116 ss-1]